MDLLAQALAGIRSRDGVLHRSVLRRPFGLHIDERSPLTIIVFVNKSGYLTFADGEQHRIEAGVVHLVTELEPYELRDRPESALRLYITDTGVVRSDGTPLPMPRDDVECLIEESVNGDAHTTVISGNYLVGAGIGQRVLSGLPRIVAVDLPGTPHFVAILEAALGASTGRHSSSGRQPVLDRWLDLLMTAAIRHYLADTETGPAWNLALADPQIGVALEAMHAQPSAPWTLDTLARISRMSRSTFAERFAGVLGDPPRSYLTQLRMELATDLLIESDTPLAGIAAAVGYANPFGFSAAYKRERGLSPAAVRAQQRFSDATQGH
ncbi:MAG: cupin domain-containing protein [Cumulibacter sp.]